MINGLRTYALQALISAPKIPADFLWGLSLFFVVIAAVYFVFVFFFKNKLSRKAKQIIAKMKVFSPMIGEFLFYDELEEKKEKTFAVRKKAIAALNTVKPEGVQPTNDMVPKEEFKNIISASIKVVNVLGNHAADNTTEKDSLTNDTLVRPELITLSKNIETEITPEEIAFLPLITDSIADILEPIVNRKDTLIPINQIDVQFEEVLNLPKADELYFEFLPIVTEEKNENETAKANHELMVDFDEVIASVQEVNETVTPNKLLNEILITYEELAFSDLDHNDVVSSDVIKIATLNTDEMVTEEEPLFSDEISSEKLFELNVHFDVVVPKPIKNLKVESFTTEIDWNSAFKNKDEKLDNETWTIPKPLFYKSTILKTILLLENIAELGDQREIPFLQELLHKETNAVVVERIHMLIAGFTKEDESQNLLNFNVDQIKHSIFYNLLADKDLEIKLLLVNEIAVVGDEKEIPLLKELCSSGNTRIHKAAEWALKQIYKRCSVVKKATILELDDIDEENKQENVDFKDKDETLTMNFDIENLMLNTSNKRKERPYASTLFDKLCAMSTKLYDKN